MQQQLVAAVGLQMCMAAKHGVLTTHDWKPSSENLQQNRCRTVHHTSRAIIEAFMQA
jgi:hypothetical protein